MCYLKKQNNDKKILEEIVNELKKYDIYDFLTRISALNLLPYNQNKCIVFDAIINAILHTNLEEFTSKNLISINKFNEIINIGMSLDIAKNIDPVCMPFIHRVFFYGNRWIFSGINTNSGYNLQAMLDVLFKKENKFNKLFISKCSRMAEVVLRITTAMVESLGYDISILNHFEKKDVDFPTSLQMKKLCSFVLINTSEIENIIDEEAQTNLFYNQSNYVQYEHYNNYAFFYSPVLKLSSTTAIVLNPSMLSTFLIHYIIKTAKVFGIFEELLELYNEEIWLDCKRSLFVLNHQKINEMELGIELKNDDCYKEVILSATNNRVMFVQFFCDNGEKYKITDMFANHRIKGNLYGKRYKYIEEKLKSYLCKSIYQLVIISSFGRGVGVTLRNKRNNKKVILTPFELFCISVNEEKHDNFIPYYIESKANFPDPIPACDSNIYDIVLYASNRYSFYVDDKIDMHKTMRFAGFGDSVDYMNNALKKEDRQLVKYPNSVYLKEVVLLDAKRNIYCSKNLDQIELLNKFSNINIWTKTPVIESLQMLNVVNSISDLISYWLGELKPIIEKQEFLFEDIEIQTIIEEDVSKYYIVQDVNDQPLSEEIHFESLDNTIKIIWPASAHQKLAVQNNSKEKELMVLILNELCKLCRTSYKLEEVNVVFGNSLKKKMFSLDYQNAPYLKPIDNKFRKIPIECEETLLDEIGSYLLNDKKIPYGIIEEDKSNICKDIVTYLYNKMSKLIEGVNKKYFYELIYFDLERVMSVMMLNQKRYAFDIACYPERADEIARENNELNKSSIAMKFLMEYIAAKPPKGDSFLGEMEYEYLLALCSEIIHWAHQSDLFQYKIIDSEMNMLTSGRIGINKEQINSLSEISYVAYTRRLEDASNPYIAKHIHDGLISKAPNETNEAFQDEFGYTYTEFVECIFSLLDIGDEIQGEIKRANIKEIYNQISSSTKIDEIIVRKVIDDLSLKERADFFVPPENFEPNDVKPWKFNRRLSFSRRPIIFTEGDIIWGNRQLYHCLRFTTDLICNGKLKAKSEKLKKLIGKISDKRGNDFNDAVFKRINDLNCFDVYEKVKRINGKKIMSEEKKDLGDIDVLIINKKKKKIIVSEVKDFSFSKTPFEMQQQYIKVFQDDGKKLCYMSKHKKRVSWIEKHIDDVIEHYNLGKGKWKVVNVLIVSEPITSKEFYNVNQKMILFTDINKKNIMAL